MRPLSSLRTPRAFGPPRLVVTSSTRHLHSSRATFQQQPAASSSAHGNFYKSHGRALAKTLTLAFLSYQCFYWAWITLETEAEKDGKNRQIKSLEKEVNLLEEGKNSHLSSGGSVAEDVTSVGKRLLEEGRKS